MLTRHGDFGNYLIYVDSRLEAIPRSAYIVGKKKLLSTLYFNAQDGSLVVMNLGTFMKSCLREVEGDAEEQEGLPCNWGTYNLSWDKRRERGGGFMRNSM